MGTTRGIELVGGDGAGRMVLAAPKGLDLGSPSWSPDGTRLVAEGTRLPGDAERESTRLYVVDAASGRVSALPGGNGLTGPAWSPDGAAIAAVQRAGLTIWIVVLPATGGTPRALTAGPFDSMPAWSPDGTRIAFVRAQDRGGGPLRPKLMVAAADGSGARELATEAYSPAWSPDGASIAFVSSKERNGETCGEDCAPHGELHVIGADGSGDRRLTTTKADESGPAWSPDGTRIAYTSDRNSQDAGPELFAVDPDGGCPTQLTWAASIAFPAPAWQPGPATAERGPCGATAVPYALDFDIRRFAPAGTRPLWLGPQLGRLRVSSGDPGSLEYAECDGFDLAGCPGPLQVQLDTICHRNPVAIDLPATAIVAARGALAIGYQDRFEVLSGGTTTVVFTSERSVSPARIRTLVAQLRPAGSDRTGGRLARPRLTRAALRALRHPSRARRHEPLFGDAIARSDRRVYAALRRLHATSGPSPPCAR